GCNNIALTWPTGTALATVDAAVNPADALIAIWRFDSAAQRFRGFAPAAGPANDLTTVRMLDAVFVCLSAAGSLALPGLPETGSSPTPSPTPSATVSPGAGTGRDCNVA